MLDTSSIPSAPRHGACLHCRAPLGQNDLLAALPVGRRFAYDMARERLWIVCPSCRRWCLSSAYALPEVFEACERAFQEAPKRTSAGRMSMARHASGVELIRSDGASEDEVATWRYGDRASPPTRWRAAVLGEAAEAWVLERRDRLRGTLAGVPFLAGGLGLGAISDAALAETTALGLVLLAFFRMFTLESELHEKQLRRLSARAHVAIGRITDVEGSAFVLHADEAWRSRLAVDAERGGLRLTVPAGSSRGHAPPPATHVVEAREATRVLRLALSEAGSAPAGAAAIRSARRAIESAGGAHAYLASAAAESARLGFRYAALGELPRTLRLPLAIAADAVHESSSVEDGPEAVEREWQEAAELAELEMRAGRGLRAVGGPPWLYARSASAPSPSTRVEGLPQR